MHFVKEAAVCTKSVEKKYVVRHCSDRTGDNLKLFV